jgi:protein-S-isoprenylcysteine O-methyltransferase Ste14
VRGIRPSTTQSTAALYAKSLLNAILFFAVFMVAAPWASRRILPRPIPLPILPRSLAGGALMIAGASVWIACLDVFSRRGRGTPFPLDAPSRLVTSGPFGVIRNPIMAAELAFIWGEALYFGSFGILAYAAAVTLAAHLLVTRVEEPELRERFGEQFEAYCRRVPRWLPAGRKLASS